MFTLALNRVTGMFQSGKYAYAGQFLYAKFYTIEDAKAHVTEEFKLGYYNHATICNRNDDINIERFKGHDWTIAKED